MNALPVEFEPVGSLSKLWKKGSESRNVQGVRNITERQELVSPEGHRLATLKVYSVFGDKSVRYIEVSYTSIGVPMPVESRRTNHELEPVVSDQTNVASVVDKLVSSKSKGLGQAILGTSNV